MRQATATKLGLLLGATALLSACGEDDYQYPDLVTELGELVINGEGLGSDLTTDSGRTFDISYLGVQYSVTDTVVRCYCQYAETDEGVTMYTLTNSNVYCAPPSLTYAVATDPVDIISAWATDRYLNLYIGVLTGEDVEHAFAFSLDSISQGQGSDGDTWTLHHTLVHLASDDAQHYTERSYISFPLFSYSAYGFDSVQLTVNTYDGVRSFTAPIP